MRAVVQRVTEASVTIDGLQVASIDKGLLVLVGIKADDTEKDMEYIMNKVLGLRIFEDDADKMNLSIRDIKGEVLIVPNFTLYGDARKGRRPGFSAGAAPAVADGIFQKLLAQAKELPVPVEAGQFQTHMMVELINDGPVTLLLDSEKTF